MHNCIALTHSSHPAPPPPSLPPSLSPSHPPSLLALLPSNSRSSSIQSGGGLEAESRSSSRGSLEELSQFRHREASSAPPCGSAGGTRQKMLLDYNVYMAKYINLQETQRTPTATDSPGPASPESSPKTAKKVGDKSKPPCFVAWIVTSNLACQGKPWHGRASLTLNS